MDDLGQAIQKILSDDQSMQKLQEMAKSLGLSDHADETVPASGGFDLSAMASMLGNTPPSLPQESPPADEEPPFDPMLLMQVVNTLRSSRQDTPGTAFLRALKPLLRKERQSRVDEAIRMMRLFALWPVLQQSGALQGLLNRL